MGQSEGFEGRVPWGPTSKERPTRTDETFEKYSKRFDSLWRRFEREVTGGRGMLFKDYPRFAAWLLEMEQGLKPASWRQYRSAVIAVCEDVDNEDALKAIAMLRRNPDDLHDLAPEAGLLLKVKDAKGKGKATELSLQTSAKKDKRLRWDDFQTLAEVLRADAGKTYGRYRNVGPLLYTWLHVGMLIGMRPDEHFGTTLYEGITAVPFGARVVLRVPNAKNTNGRAFGPYRHLILDDMEPADLGVIRAHFKALGEMLDDSEMAGETREKAFKRLLDRCRKRMGKVTAKIWPRRKYRPTMYSSRHQFIADAKGSGFEKKSLGALVGHGSEDTAGIHYAKRNVAEHVVKIRPHPDDVRLVRAGRSEFDRLQNHSSFKGNSGEGPEDVALPAV